MAYFTAWAYNNETGRTRRCQRRYASLDGAQTAIMTLVSDDSWGWVQGPRGAARPTDWHGERDEGDWVLVVRRHD